MRKRPDCCVCGKKRTYVFEQYDRIWCGIHRLIQLSEEESYIGEEADKFEELTKLIDKAIKTEIDEAIQRDRKDK